MHGMLIFACRFSALSPMFICDFSYTLLMLLQWPSDYTASLTIWRGVGDYMAMMLLTHTALIFLYWCRSHWFRIINVCSDRYVPFNNLMSLQHWYWFVFQIKSYRFFLITHSCYMCLCIFKDTLRRSLNRIEWSVYVQFALTSVAHSLALKF